MEAKLIVIGGKANKSEIKLKLPTTIGRSRKADLTIAHPKVSRQHCQIFERDGVLIVRDNGSLNGTLIDNDRITEAILKPGDKLTVGPLTFVAVYEHSGPLPPLTADLPTPAIEAIELPQPVAKVGRGPSKPVVAGSIKPSAPSPKPMPIVPPEPAESGEPTFMEPPQPETIAAITPTPEAEDFSWLTGDTVPAPSPEPPAAPRPPMADTVTMKLPAEPEGEKLDLSGAPAPPEADAADAPHTAEDFSWLDDSQQASEEAPEEPVDLSAFEATEPEGPLPPVVKPSSERTLVQEQGPTVIVPTRNLLEAATVAEIENAEQTAPAADAPAPEETAPAEMASDEAVSAEPANEEESEFPDFGAMTASPPEDEPAFPPIVASSSAPASEAKSGSSASPAAHKGAEKKGWWPFGGKKKAAPAKPSPAAPPKESNKPAEEEAPAPAAAAGPPAAPPQFMFPAEFAAGEAEEPAADSTDEPDEALNEFFKKLQ